MASLAIPGCASEEPLRKFVAVFVDVSGSTATADWELYQSAVTALAQDLQLGDRIVIARISDRSLTGFQEVENVEIAPTGIQLDDEDKLKAERDRLKTEGLSKVRDGALSEKTRILDAVDASAELFRSARQPEKWLVLLSDMLENSEQANFQSRSPEKLVSQIVERKKKAASLPDLKGVRVYVVGAGAKDQQRYFEVRKFWEAYFEAAGAAVASYGRTTTFASPPK